MSVSALIVHYKMKELDISTKGYAMVDRDVKTGQTTGRVFVSNDWIRHTVQVIFVDPLLESDNE
jgi:hypothetical protein